MDEEGIRVNDLMVTGSRLYILDAVTWGLSTEGAGMIVELSDDEGETATCDGVVRVGDGFVGGEEETLGGSTDNVGQDHGSYLWIEAVVGMDDATVEDNGR